MNRIDEEEYVKNLIQEAIRCIPIPHIKDGVTEEYNLYQIRNPSLKEKFPYDCDDLGTFLENIILTIFIDYKYNVLDVDELVENCVKDVSVERDEIDDMIDDTISSVIPDEVIDFGKHRGKTYKEIMNLDGGRAYLIWCSKNVKNFNPPKNIKIQLGIA
jgi:hypothetical protein